MPSARDTTRATNPAIATYGGATRSTSDLATWETDTTINLTTGVQKGTISGIVAGEEFTVGEALTFTGSGATADFIGLSPAGDFMYYDNIGGTPANGDAISGDVSGDTATLDATGSSGGVSPIMDCYADSATFDDDIQMAGATPSSSFFRTVRAASGEGHDGTKNNGFFIDQTAAGHAFRSTEANSEFQDIIIKNRFASGTTYSIYTDAVDIKVIGCISVDSDGGSAYGIRVRGNNTIAVLCLADNIENHGIIGAKSGATTYHYNCTSVKNGGRGIDSDGGTMVCKNCLHTENGDDDFDAGGTFTGSVTNVSDDTTAADLSIGVNTGVTDFTTVYENIAGKDFHLKADASTDMRNAGTDLSSDGTFAFNDDINDGTMGGGKSGELWFDWDIGFDEDTVAAVGRTTKNTHSFPLGHQRGMEIMMP